MVVAGEVGIGAADVARGVSEGKRVVQGMLAYEQPRGTPRGTGQVRLGTVVYCLCQRAGTPLQERGVEGRSGIVMGSRPFS